ncbi:hypothetical protein BGX38DRAFT_1139970 [Terfezia claveryi]|nr:hypothetical protein BGX38DRAFT_1139970 [Terfezia claveryi]
MRFIGSLLAAGLSTIAVATACSLPSRDISSVYYKPSSKNPSENTDIPTLSRLQFTLALAHRLGLSQFHSLTQQNDVDAITKIDAAVPRVEFLEGDGKGKLVVHISNVHREMFSDIKPTFNVDSKQAAIDQSIFKHAEEVMGAGLRPEWILDVNYDSTNRIEVLSNSFLFTQENSIPWDGSDDEGLSSLVTPKALSKLDPYNLHHQIFVTGFTSLQHILQDGVKTAINRGEYVFIHVPILNWLEANSEVYATGVDLLSAYFHHLLTTHDHHTISDLTLIVSPTSQHPYTQPPISSELKKRKEIPISIISSPASPHPAPQALTSAPNSNANPPVFTTSNTRVPATFKDKSTCEAQTNQCSSHGSCVMSSFPIKDSWSCRCHATTTETKSGVIKTHWAGNACQKQDISVQFHLILILTILLVGGIAAVIALMMDMGAQELPGVLTAGMPAKKQ